MGRTAVRRRLRGSQRQQGQWGRTRAVIGFANNRAGGQTVHLRLQSLPLGSLLFAVFVERVHDVVQPRAALQTRWLPQNKSMSGFP